MKFNAYQAYLQQMDVMVVAGDVLRKADELYNALGNYYKITNAQKLEEIDFPICIMKANKVFLALTELLKNEKPHAQHNPDTGA